jgi:predicted amidohydrolase YtcJ
MKKGIRTQGFAGGALALLAVIVAGAAQPERPADLVLLHGKIATMDKGRPFVSAVAVRQDRIAAAGNDADIARYVGKTTRVIDLRGRLAIPGFIDSHAHFMGIGKARMELDLRPAKTWDEIVALVAAAAKSARPGDWILGQGWHQEKWDSRPSPNVEGLPFHQELSRVSPDNPVLLTHASGHSLLANAKAMELAGISAKTPDPPGGQILRDGQGNPIGAFRETAQGLIGLAYESSQRRRPPAEREADEIRAIGLANEECLAKGITSLDDAGEPLETIDLFKKLAEDGKLGIRLYAMIGDDNARLRGRLQERLIIGAGQNHLTVRSIKRFMDGALGSNGAWMLAPYLDLPGSTGLNTTPLDVMRETARLAIENGFQLCTHAIGDRANRETLDIYEAAMAGHPEKKNLRWRIEHAQHLDPADIPRFARLGVIASMQGVHASSDGPWVIGKIGEKRARAGAYVWHKLLDTGALVCNGTDAPVEDVNPIACFYASVTRRMNNGQAFFPEECMTREEALASYTINGAYASFREGDLGSLTVGKLADITVLSADIMTISEDQIPKTTVVMTIVGGRILYQKP